MSSFIGIFETNPKEVNVMKPYFLATILIILCTDSCFANSRESIYKVYRIDSVNSFYIIYCSKDAQNYKIVSEKKDVSSNDFVRVEVGGFYNLILKSLPGKGSENPLTNNSSLLISCYMFDKDTENCREPGINGLFTSPNLVGLYISSKP